MLPDLTSPLSSHLAWDADPLESDMRVFASVLNEWLSDPRIVADLISAHLRDPALTRAVMDTVGAVIGPWIEQLTERARQRGESDPPPLQPTSREHCSGYGRFSNESRRSPICGVWLRRPHTA